MQKSIPLQKLGWFASFAIFIAAAILMYVLTTYLIPYLSESTGQETIVFWFIVGGLGIFTPLIILGLLMLKKEGYQLSKQSWTERLRFHKPSKSDLIWAIGGLVAAGAASALLMAVMERLLGQFDHSPAFMTFEPLTKGRYWLLLLWLPYWLLNIMGEEFLWRGVMLPRQEVAFGRYAWIIHGFGWALFHIAFGWELLITLLPLIFIQTYIVQRRKNSWIGVIMHGGLNGPAFLAIAFGLI